MEYKLVIDATGDDVNLHLIFNNTIKENFIKSNNRDLTFNLAKYVQQILLTAQIDVSQLYGIYLVYGPGKFSATRTSAILVKTFKMFYHHIKLFIMDKFNYFAADNTLVVLKSDANKYFVNYFKKINDNLNPWLLDDIELKQLIDKNSHWKIVNETNKDLNIINSLSRFKEVDENFILEYFKPAC